MKYSEVPVITYHSIGIVNRDWIWKHLTCHWKLFQQHLRLLKRMNFNTISLQQLYNYKKNGTELPHRSIVLTFDDGYLDNWVFAYPLLRKYDFKGTIFISPEFVDQRSIVRKNLDDVWSGKETINMLQTTGFLSWDEIMKMDAEGVMDVQSHTMSHTWYFCENEIVDFHYPENNKYPWLSWNRFPERKSYYLTEDYESFIPYGTPIYKHGRSLGIRRYFEDKDLTEYLVNFVNSEGINFFKGEDWGKKLFSEVESYKREKGLKGRYETNEEQIERFKYELIKSKNILEGRLKKKINFLCWPGDANTDISVRKSCDIGYIAYTYPQPNVGGNTSLKDASKIYRISSPNIRYKGRIYYLGGVALIMRFFASNGCISAKIIQKVMRLFIVLLIVLKIKKGGLSIPQD